MQSAIDTLRGKHFFDQTDVADLSGRTVLVTGGTLGISFEVAKSSAVSRARVLILSRKLGNGETAVQRIQSETSGGADIEFIEIDLGNLNTLVAGAGIGVNEYALSSDGIEHHFSVNNLGHIFLINRLLPLIRRTAALNEFPAPRIVQISSSLHLTASSSIKFASLEEVNDESIGPNALYARSKLANILFTRWLAAHVFERGSRIYALATHPGAVATGQQDQLKDAYGTLVGGMIKGVVTPILRQPEQGSLSTLWAATSEEIEEKDLQGVYITDPGEWGGESKQSQDEILRENLWSLSHKLIQEKAGEDAFLDWSDANA
ncbi:hypothetical protein EW145_g1596 [Phellinidium pouzarii]|uniref:Ketoreductase (KR) domain-containing protein n=1 Tax=Phellinidium pouzarii TaxID=167371 RepID=A0A4S4LDV3_9AGAM|nr:hypothetical protein EW145_g1596 [Phellinidium pouzarii]